MMCENNTTIGTDSEEIEIRNTQNYNYSGDKQKSEIIETVYVHHNKKNYTLQM